MHASEVKNGLNRIAKNYPTLMGLLMKKMPSGETLGAQWAEVLRNLNEYYFNEVCDEYADLKTPLPEPIDQLVFHIKHEVDDRYQRDYDRFLQHEKYHSRKKTKGGCEFMRPIRESWNLGIQVRDGKMTQAECKRKTDELADWSAGGEKPQWLDHPGE